MKALYYSNKKSPKNAINLLIEEREFNYIKDCAKRMQVDIQTVIDHIIETRYNYIKSAVPGPDKSETDKETHELRKKLKEAAAMPDGEKIQFKGYTFTTGKEAARLLCNLNKQFKQPSKNQLKMFESEATEATEAVEAAEAVTPSSKKNNVVPSELLEAFTGCGCTLGRCKNTKFMQLVRVSNCGNDINFLYRGSKRGAVDEVKRQFAGFVDAFIDCGGRLNLYYNQSTTPEIVATFKEYNAEELASAAMAWQVEKNCFAPLPLALPAVTIQDSDTASDTATEAQAETVTPSNQKTTPIKKFTWDGKSDEEKHPEPANYKTIKNFAEQQKSPYIDVYEAAAQITDEVLNKKTDAWKELEAGFFLHLDDCGLKMDNAANISGVIENMVFSDQRGYTDKNLCMIEKIIDCSDEELQLFPYTHTLPENCALGGCRCDDDDDAAKAREMMIKHNTEATNKNYYRYFYTLVTMLKSPNYCVFIDAEGYTWCRYVLLLPSWREMFADDIEIIAATERQRQEEEAAAKLVEEANEILNYQKDCDRLRPWMVVDLSAYELNDRKSRQNGRRRNILAALKHFFPGQKFSVAYKWASHDEIEISWTDGPTIEDVKNCCNWSIFCDCWSSFDGMDDSWDYGDRKYCDFAQQYGGGYLNEINFDRNFSAARTDAANAAARDLLVSCGVPSTANGVHHNDDKYMQVWNAIANRFGKYVAEWLNAWSWLDTYSISRSIMANNADLTPAI